MLHIYEFMSGSGTLASKNTHTHTRIHTETRTHNLKQIKKRNYTTCTRYSNYTLIYLHVLYVCMYICINVCFFMDLCLFVCMYLNKWKAFTALVVAVLFMDNLFPYRAK